MDASIATFRETARALLEKSGAPPTVEEVAAVLQLNTQACRQLIQDAHRHSGISWRELGVDGRPLTRSRELLRDALAMISSPRAKAFIISEILAQQRCHTLSIPQTRLLVFSVLSGQHTYTRLDKAFASLVGIEPKVVSNILHDSRCSRRGRSSLIDRLEDEISAKGAVGSDFRSREYPYREFVANAISYLRGFAKSHLFTLIMQSKAGQSESARIVAPLLRSAIELRIPPHLHISENHALLLTNLIEKKCAGAFSTMKALASELHVDLRGLHAALQGRGKYLGIYSKIADTIELYPAHFAKLQSAAEGKFPELLARVASQPVVSERDAAEIKEALSICSRLRTGLSDNQRAALQVLLDDSILSRERATAERALALGISPNSFTQLLRDNKARQGVFSFADAALLSLPEEESSRVLNVLIPYSLESCKGIIQSLCRFQSVSSRNSKLFTSLMLAIDSFVQSLHPAPRVRVAFDSSGRKETRYLRPEELGSLVVGYVSKARGDLEYVRRNISSLLSSREALTISEASVRRIKHGSHPQQHVAIGAASRLHQLCTRHSDTLALLNATHTLNVESNETISDNSIRENPLSWSISIVQSKGPADGLKLASIFCASRPHTAREIFRVASRIAEHAEDPTVARFLSELSLQTYQTTFGLDSNQAARLFASSLAHNCGLSTDAFKRIVRYLSSSCTQRVASFRVLGDLLGNLHRLKDGWSEKACEFIEVWGSISAAADSTGGRSDTITKRAFLYFLEQSIAKEISAEKLIACRFRYFEILEAIYEKQRSRDAAQQKSSELIETFYRDYSISKIIQRYCKQHIQSPFRPRGIPFDELYEIAIQAVIEATTKYDPDRYLKAGRPVASFSTFALSMIRWTIGRYAHHHIRDQRHIAYSLNDEIGTNDEEFVTITPSSATADRPEEDSENCDGFSVERLASLLSELSPLSRRLLEARFFIGEGMKGEGVRSLREIAAMLYSERLTETQLTAEGVRFHLFKALAEARLLVWGKAADDWLAFFSTPDPIDVPGPVALPIKKGVASLSQELRFNLKGTNLSKKVVLKIAQVADGLDGESEILVQALSPTKLLLEATFMVGVKKGGILCCERMD